MTLRQAISDIKILIKQTKDDREYTDYQILFWVLMYANRLKVQHLNKRDSGAFLHIYNQVPILKDDIGRKYIALPASIYDLDRDEGIHYLSYDYTIDECNAPFTSVNFTRTTPKKSQRLYFTEEEKPSPSNPYFYRVASNIYLLGLECIEVSNLEIGLFTSLEVDTDCDIDADFDFPNELYPVLQMNVLNVARFGLSIPNDTINTGADNIVTSQIPKQKIISVNQDAQQEQ